MNASQSDLFKPLVLKATAAISEVTNLLKAGEKAAEGLGSLEDSPIERAQALELILQFRLDTQDALVQLLQIDQSVLQILGIGSHQSVKINLERLQFALGKDDLRLILYALGQLIQSLTRIAQRYQRQNKQSFVQKQASLGPRKEASYLKFDHILRGALEKQKIFLSLLNQLQLNLDSWNKRAAVGPVLDHISALQGPISHFYQAVQNGLAQTHHMYELMSIQPNLRLEKTPVDLTPSPVLGPILKQAELILSHLPTFYPKMEPFFAPKTTVEKKLEERAAVKRLGHFFRY